MKNAFAANLPALTWMSAESAAAAKHKLDHMVELVGYPRFVLNDTWLDNLFSSVEVSGRDYLLNLVTHRYY